ncbi:hypothetical protein OsJ_26652 [Oryza sativa Japonica Group]|uniref:Cytochrome P450 n=1 Tax=Oryza sativa subsp. japonica TaxID=39947 RepID=A3BRA2_ORYSJ|nr:hypothetical protein OsJ_26652 [Oryza sativa Japonica Group]
MASLTPSLQDLLVSSLMILLVLLYIAYWRSKYQSLFPVDWPIVGLLPTLVANLHRLHDYLTDVLAASGHSFTAHGPAATNMRLFVTCEPDNVRHIFTTNHDNYPKGQHFAEIFDILAGIPFTMDGELCRRQRAKTHSILSDPRMVASMQSSCVDKVRDGLIPFLTSVASTQTPIELQDLATRLMFDVTAMPVFGVDPGCLSPDMPSKHVSAAMDTIMEVALFRHTVPPFCWKAMRRLKIGPERKLAAAHAALHVFVSEMVEKARTKQEEAAPTSMSMDVISSYINDPDYNDLLHSKLISYMVAGRDTVGTTLPWFFYNLAMNPRVVSGIREELAHNIATSTCNGDGVPVMFSPEDTKSLVYLHAALFETLRLYPPGWIERKTVVADDVMPSGHEDGELWGEDCRVYRPERWLYDSRGGRKMRHVPSHKFLSFNSGPRMCPGKNIAVMQMKIIAAAVVWNFDLEVVEGQAVVPKLSCLLQMKNGVMVKVKKRAV